MRRVLDDRGRSCRPPPRRGDRGAGAPSHREDAGHGDSEARLDQRDLAQVRRATTADFDLRRAIDDGYGAFAIPPEVGGTPTTGLGLPGSPTCFDSDKGGMGVHYVKGIDGDVSATEPEALVYEITRGGGLRLVAVEYIVPEELVDPQNPPALFGQAFHHHPYLPVYILHAWIWKANPNGMFADFNPRVGDCPTPGPSRGHHVRS